MRNTSNILRHWRGAAVLCFIVCVLVATFSITPTLATTYKASSATRNAQKSLHTTLLASGDYTLKATEIVGSYAHLSLKGDPLHPVLSFTAVSISGFQLSHAVLGGAVLTISASGLVTGTGVALKTSIFSDLGTALGSFTNKLNLLTLITGGTVRNLVMKNVNLKVDRYMTATTITFNGLQLSVS